MVPPKQSQRRVPDVWAELPYDSFGERLAESSGAAARTTLTLTPGSRVRIVRGNAPMAPDGLEGADHFSDA